MGRNQTWDSVVVLTLRRKCLCFSSMLAREFVSRQPFSIKRLPLLARFYCQAYHAPMTMWRSRGRRVLFSMLYALCRTSRGEFDYERLGRHKAIQFNAHNLQFQALYAPFARKGYEPEVALLIDSLLPERGTFFDIGSNWGYFSLYAASNREQLTIHAFEPLPQTFRDLKSCVEQAGLAEFIHCHHLALSDSAGEVFIDIPDHLHSGQARVSERPGSNRVAVKRLDDLGLPPPDFIKMDVEGHEAEVLNGAEGTLRANRPFIVFENKPFDAAPQKTSEPLFFLSALGYRLYVPAVSAKTASSRYYTPAGQGVDQADSFVLIPLEAGTRLLWHPDLNIFACHESRLSELLTVFENSTLK